jgi:hypothetical protein
MKALSFVIWLSWASLLGRVLLAPVFRLTLSEALLLLLVGAPAIGLFCWLRWLLRKLKATRQHEMGSPTGVAVPRSPVSLPRFA